MVSCQYFIVGDEQCEKIDIEVLLYNINNQKSCLVRYVIGIAHA
jgi:hypothetical protein